MSCAINYKVRAHRTLSHFPEMSDERSTEARLIALLLIFELGK